MESGLFAIVGLVIGLLVGGVVVWLVVRLRSADATTRLQQEASTASELRSERDSLRTERDEANRELAAARASLDSVTTQNQANANELKQSRDANQQAERIVASLQQQLLEANRRLEEQGDIEKTLTDQFKVLATEVIDSNNEKFLTAADEKVGNLVHQAKKDFDLSKEAVSDLVRPLSEELKRIETARAEIHGSLNRQLEDLANNNQALQQEARNLTTALKAPQVRGRWGEVQLRRVVELAGMSDHCDFREQVQIPTENATSDRPDVIVYMPGNRNIVVDAKTPLNAYLESVESETYDDREKALERHADQVRARARELSQKAYWRSLPGDAPEFVVMFLPGEFFLQPALERDPQLMEWTLERGVVIATPNTLVALLRTVELGWKEVQLAKTAKHIGEMGQDLHDRLSTFANHMNRMGSSLKSTVDHFNSGVGSLERRVFPKAREFKQLGISSNQDIAELSQIDTSLRQLPATDLSEENGSLAIDTKEISS